MSATALGLSAAQPPAGAPSPCVVHLVRAANGIEPFRTFIESYIRHPAGIEHGLVLLFKGFVSERDADPYLELADGLDAQPLFVSDRGLDLTVYRAAAERLDESCYCFLNSFSVLLAPDWLKHLYAALLLPEVGVVGATGSWGSIRSYARFMLGLGGPYGGVLPDRRTTTTTIAAVGERNVAEAPGSGRGRRKVPVVSFAAALLGQAYGFRPFPACHLRTTGFMIGGDVLTRLRLPEVRRKNDAYRLESGSKSITAQVQGLQMAALLVGRDGRSYGATDWPASRTFWQGEQENLLIGDKQTANYQEGDATVRRVLSAYAWGGHADPGPARL